jgi:hypothetical protein
MTFPSAETIRENTETQGRFDLSTVVERYGLRGLVQIMDDQGEVPFVLLLQGIRTVPSTPETAFQHVKEGLIEGQAVPLITAALSAPGQQERLNVRLDVTPAKSYDGTAWQAVEVSGKLNVAALLGLPAREPVAEARHLMQAWDNWETYWGPAPTTAEAWKNRPTLQIYKVSDMNPRGFAWCGESVTPDTDERFAAALANDPLLTEWKANVQRKLAAQRLGAHSWVSVRAMHVHGDEAYRKLWVQENAGPRRRRRP